MMVTTTGVKNVEAMAFFPSKFPTPMTQITLGFKSPKNYQIRITLYIRKLVHSGTF